MKYDFETLVDRRRAGALKWDLMRQAQPNAPEDAVPLSVADMEFVIAPEIRAALHQYIDAQIPGYSGAPEGFRESVCSFLRRPSWSVCFPGRSWYRRLVWSMPCLGRFGR